MVSTADFDPVVVEPQLTPQKVKELLERRMESAKLDYKLEFDPSNTVHKVKLAKHAMAMSNTAGGYIVIGVQDDGVRRGATPGLVARIDEATVRAQLSAYTAARVAVFVDASVQHEGLLFPIITVLPLRDILAVASSDGNCADGTLFRKGDVLVRHGTASERWNQQDTDYILRRIAQAKKDDWIREFGNDLRRLIRQEAGSSPEDIDQSIYNLPPEDFQKLVLRTLRRPGG